MLAQFIFDKLAEVLKLDFGILRNVCMLFSVLAKLHIFDVLNMVSLFFNCGL